MMRTLFSLKPRGSIPTTDAIVMTRGKFIIRCFFNEFSMAELEFVARAVFL